MQSAQIIKYGGKEAIAIKDIPRPAIGPGKVLVEVYAAGVNPVDWKLRSGNLRKWMPLDLPATLGSDLAGVVVESGADVTRFGPGDEVYGRGGIMNGSTGSFAEFDLAQADAVALKPKTAGFTEAGALPLAGVSALQGIVDLLKLGKGRKVLIQGGAGGIGSYAVQIARHLGVFVAATARGPDLEFVTGLGADKVIDFEKHRFEESLSDYDAVFDTVGGEVFSRSLKVLRKGGTIVSMLEQPDPKLMERLGITGIHESTDVNFERLTRLAELVEQGRIKTHLAKVFPLEMAGEALRYLEKERPRGKVVLKIK